MDSKELRIGNYINFGSTVSEVFGITVTDVMFKYSTGNEEKYAKLINEGIQPVPLTEEWLVKFKFVKVRDYPVFRLNGLQIEFNGFDSEWGAGLLDKKTIIKYVHQLQNLYFALTGKELTLKN